LNRGQEIRTYDNNLGVQSPFRTASYRFDHDTEEIPVAIKKLDHYADVQQFIASILTANNQGWTHSPHKNFWETMTYDQFVNGNVPHVSDPDTGSPMPILVKGNSAQSNLIMSLRGTAGTAFDPTTSSIGRMPANGPPFFTDDQINSIADWIDRGCPQ
jgi:hypothetical protein